MKTLHIHADLLQEFEQFKKEAVYCIPKGKNTHGTVFDCDWKHRSLKEELEFIKKFKTFKAKNDEAWKKQFER